MKSRKRILFFSIGYEKKISEIIENPEHYKPLRHGMKGIRRAHIDPFVLTFEVMGNEKHVVFLDFDHHDKIYL
ncbi:MAG: hypothetical protein CVT48_05615 [Thermoplasmata archaeon HGW-Thermoplasmata-1]|nr:MAG: hypothetical protein CVT48_05615 [Thermoplasmata archaeon HGW-Thermoplasmata-1]